MTELEPAGMGTRLIAWVVDRLILAGLWLFVAAWGFVAYLHVIRWPPDLLNLAALIGLLLLWWIGLHAAYFIVFVGGCGQTPGKMLLGITVVRWDGAPAGYGRALLRWIGYWVAALPLGLGFVPAFFTADRRGLHDWISATREVRRQAAPVLATSSPTPYSDAPHLFSSPQGGEVG